MDHVGYRGPVLGLVDPAVTIHEVARRSNALHIGANAVIDLTTEDFVARVDELSGGRGAYVISLSIGIAVMIEKAVAAAANRGVVSVYASVQPRGSTISVDPISRPADAFRAAALTNDYRVLVPPDAEFISAPHQGDAAVGGV